MSAPRASTAPFDPARNRPAELAAVVGTAVVAIGGGLASALLLASRVGVAGAVALGVSSLPVAWLVIRQHVRLSGRGHDASRERRAEQRKAALGVLARRALESADTLTLIGEAMELVRETLGTVNCVTNRKLAGGEIRNVASAGYVVELSIPAGAAVADRVHVVRKRAGDQQRPRARDALLGVGDRARERSVPRAERPRPPARRRPPRDPGPAPVRRSPVHRGGGPLPPGDRIRDRRRARPRGERARADAAGAGGSADRPGESGAPAQSPGIRAAARPAARGCRQRALGRPRPLQGVHRHGRPPRRRHAAAKGGGAAVRLSCARRTSSRATAATSSRSCAPGRRPTTPSPRCAQRIVDALVEPFEIEGREVSITASVGVAVSQHGDETPEELLRDAVAAMHRARELGGGRFEAFDASLRHRLVERMSIESDLRYAVERDELELHFQPLIGLDRRDARRVRGAGSLAPPRARDGPSRRVHQRRRGDRADPAGRHLGARAGLRAARAVARARRDRGQHLAAPDQA